VTRRREIPLSDPGLKLRHVAPPRRCEAPGCVAAGEFRAPRSRQRLDDYFWFCLEHVRQYNSSWNYFQGMSDVEVQRFQREAIIGHRPTWRMSDRRLGEACGTIRDSFGLFGGGQGERAVEERELRHVPVHVRRAMAELGLDGRPDLQQIKMRYKQLVKRYHPDANGGDRSVEERFKAITAAYRTLLASGSF
jgi:hypothetical protein